MARAEALDRERVSNCRFDSTFQLVVDPKISQIWESGSLKRRQSEAVRQSQLLTGHRDYSGFKAKIREHHVGNANIMMRMQRISIAESIS